MKKYSLILTASVLSVALVADGAFAQRGGRGGGGGGAWWRWRRRGSFRQPLAIDEPTQCPFCQSTFGWTARQHVPLRRHLAVLRQDNRPHVRRRQAVLRQGNRPHVPRHQVVHRLGSHQHVLGPEPARVPRLRARAPVPASIATRSRAGSAPAPDSSPRCQTGSNRVPRSYPAPVLHHRPPVNFLLGREAPKPNHQEPNHQEPNHPESSHLEPSHLWPRSPSPLNAPAPNRRLPPAAARPEHVLPESVRPHVPPHIVRPSAIRHDPGIRGIPATRAIVPDTGGIGPPPRPLRVGLPTVGQSRSTIATDRAGRSTTRTMWSTSTASSTAHRKSTTPTRRRLPRRFPR